MSLSSTHVYISMNFIEKWKKLYLHIFVGANLACFGEIIIIIITFRVIHYISNLINIRQPVIYSLRSCASTVLVFPKGKMLSTFGDRTFSMAPPKLWNALPAELRSISSLSAFKSPLKIHLFKLAFDI